MSTASSSSGIPAHVFDEVRNNETLVAKWVQDADFRSGLLRSGDPRQYALDNGCDMAQATADWVKERCQNVDIEGLLSGQYSMAYF